MIIIKFPIVGGAPACEMDVGGRKSDIGSEVIEKPPISDNIVQILKSTEDTEIAENAENIRFLVSACSALSAVNLCFSMVSS